MKMIVNYRLLSLALLSVLWLSLSGCNTVGGLGEDLEAAGEKIEDEAEEKKTYWANAVTPRRGAARRHGTAHRSGPYNPARKQGWALIKVAGEAKTKTGGWR